MLFRSRLGVVDLGLLTLEDRHGHLDGGVGQLAGVLEDRGVLLVIEDEDDRELLRVLTGNHQVGQARRAVPGALERKGEEWVGIPFILI